MKGFIHIGHGSYLCLIPDAPVTGVFGAGFNTGESDVSMINSDEMKSVVKLKNGQSVETRFRPATIANNIAKGMEEQVRPVKAYAISQNGDGQHVKEISVHEE